jgi:hypothetical protein
MISRRGLFTALAGLAAAPVAAKEVIVGIDFGINPSVVIAQHRYSEAPTLGNWLDLRDECRGIGSSLKRSHPMQMLIAPRSAGGEWPYDEDFEEREGATVRVAFMGRRFKDA